MSEDSQDDKSDFCEGLARIFSAIKAHLSSYVISAPLAYHLVTKETRFEFSHEFVYLLLAQMEDYIDGKNIHFKLKRKKEAMMIMMWINGLIALLIILYIAQKQLRI